MSKVDIALELISETMSDKSIVMSSFGKDSIVLLDLIKKSGNKCPILSFKEPFYPKKYEFANKVILDNGYIVYDYPPVETFVTKSSGNFEIINHYQVSLRPFKAIYLPTGICSYNGEYLCGLSDLLNKPKGVFDFPWDVVYIGHKSSDIDLVLGKVPLKYSKFTDESIDKTFVFPLKDFSDKDIWEYTVKENLPINRKRYNENDNWKEFSDYTYNPDYFPACIACLDKDNPELVFCPKAGKEIPNISENVPFIKVDLSHYVGE